MSGHKGSQDGGPCGKLGGADQTLTDIYIHERYHDVQHVYKLSNRGYHYPEAYVSSDMTAPARAAEPPHKARKKAKNVGRPADVVIRAFEGPQTYGLWFIFVYIYML